MGKSPLIVLDTHVVVWLAFEANRISKNARAVISETRASNEGLAISDISLLEMATIARKKRIVLNVSLESFFQEIEARFVVLPMTGDICAQAVALPKTFPSDPADRVIAATAIVNGLRLVTANREIRQSKLLRTVW